MIVVIGPGNLAQSRRSLSAIVRPHAHPTERPNAGGRRRARRILFLHEAARSVRGRPGVRPRARESGRARVRVPRSGARGGARKAAGFCAASGRRRRSRRACGAALRRGMKEALAASRRPGLAIGFDAGGLGGRVPRPAASRGPLGLRLRPLQVQAPAVRASAPAPSRSFRPEAGASRFAAAAREAEALGDAIRWVRDLGNTPGNDLGPVELAARGQAPRRGPRSPDQGPEQGRDREREDGRPPRRQRGQRPSARLPGRRVRPGRRARHGRARRQGHHVRFGRHLAQARAVDGRDEVRHDGSGDRLRLPRGGESAPRFPSASSPSPP